MFLNIHSKFMVALAIFVVMDATIIVSERNRPFWHIPVAALCFSISIGLLGVFIMRFYVQNTFISELSTQVFYCFYLIPIGIGLSLQKRVYIDLKQSRFRPTIELGSIKIGKWFTIKNYKYVSVFYRILSNGQLSFDVNLWYDNNKHFTLYNRQDYVDAFNMGYQLSEELNIDLLDATTPNDFKWIDKDDWKQQINNNAS